MTTCPLHQYIDSRYEWLLKVSAGIAKNRCHEDLLHDVLASLLERPRRFDDIIRRGEMDYFVIRSIANHQITEFNRESNRPQVVSLDHSRIEVRDQTWIGSRMDNEVLDMAMRTLPRFEHQVFSLFILDGFSYAELSKETGIPVKYLRKAVERAKEKMRKVVKKRK